MTIKEAAELYLKYVHKGESPEDFQVLATLTKACKVLKDAGIDRLDPRKLRLVSAANQPPE